MNIYWISRPDRCSGPVFLEKMITGLIVSKKSTVGHSHFKTIVVINIKILIKPKLWRNKQWYSISNVKLVMLICQNTKWNLYHKEKLMFLKQYFFRLKVPRRPEGSIWPAGPVCRPLFQTLDEKNWNLYLQKLF